MLFDEKNNKLSSESILILLFYVSFSPNLVQ